MLCANIYPKTAYVNTDFGLVEIQKVCGNIAYYDLESKKCELYYKYFNETHGVFRTGRWYVEPQSVLDGWGTDDTIILQAFANYKNFIVTSFEID